MANNLNYFCKIFANIFHNDMKPMTSETALKNHNFQGQCGQGSQGGQNGQGGQGVD